MRLRGAAGQPRASGRFAHRIRLARQRRLVDLHPVAADDDAVGGKRLAGADEGEVAGHDVGGGHGSPRPRPGRRAAVDGEPAAQSLGRSLRAPVEEGVHADQRHQRDQQRDRLGVDRRARRRALPFPPRNQIIGSVAVSRRRSHQGRRGVSTMSLRPYFARWASASTVRRPRSA